MHDQCGRQSRTKPSELQRTPIEHPKTDEVKQNENLNNRKCWMKRVMQLISVGGHVAHAVIVVVVGFH